MFAFLFGPPRFVGREEASRLHGRACDALSMEDLSFKYSSTEAIDKKSKGFSISMERKEGRGGLEVLLECAGGNQPIRLLMTHNWPPSSVHVEENFDAISKAIFEGLGGTWQKVLAEVRLRLGCQAAGENGVGYMRTRLLRLSPSWLESLDTPLSFAGIKLEFSGSQALPSPLAPSRRELTIEPLRQEPASLYLELMSQWAQLPSISPTEPIDLTRIRPIEEEPSVYLSETYGFLTERVLTLSTEQE